MRYIVGSAAAVAVIALAGIAGAQSVHQASEQRDISAEVVMKDKAFHIGQGARAQMVLLVAGTRARIRLHNDDTIAHEFVSTMLFNVPFGLSGNGTFVKTPKAAGVRVDPGQTVVVSFEVPYDSKEFQNIHESFWCAIHGKQRGDLAMRGEVLIVDQRGES